MLNHTIFVVLIIFVLSFPAFGDTLSDTQNPLAQEAVGLLQTYLAINTTNPPGNEMETALFLKKILDREGIENQIFDLGKNRANLFAVIRGDGTRKGIAFLHHMDVVSVDSEKWTVPPFSGNIKDGNIYGRGAVDIKGKGIIDLMTMVGIKRAGLSLKRDLIFLAVSDEEVGSIGSKAFIQDHGDKLKNVECLLDEGRVISANAEGKITAYYFSFGEKSPLWLTLEFSGTPGHGSLPHPDEAVNRAIRAASKILDRPKVFRVRPEVLPSLRIMLQNSDLKGLRGYSGDLETSLRNPDFLEAISASPEVNAAISDTIAITGMEGSDQVNVIPNTARLRLDCRLLPGTNKEGFLADLKKLVGDASATITIDEFYESGQSAPESDFSKALKICAERRHPNVPVVPTIVLSSTDGSLYRKLGINVYGFEPYILTEAEEQLPHGNDERISVSNISFGLDLLNDLVAEMNK